jgi:hypothetical protein
MDELQELREVDLTRGVCVHLWGGGGRGGQGTGQEEVGGGGVPS